MKFLESFAIALLLPGLAPGAAPTSDPKAGEPADKAAIEQQLREAQQQLEQAAKEVASLSLQLNEPLQFRILKSAHGGVARPMLGIGIGGDPATAPKQGARVMSVSPGGPGAEAGLKANDVIVTYDHKPVRASGKHGAGHALQSLIGASQPGTAVDIEYLRDNVSHTAHITPQLLTPPEGAMALAFGPDGMVPPEPPDLPDPGNLPTLLGFHTRHHGGLGSAEFVQLTPQLGSYFGTDKGLLVVRAPRAAHFQLEEGDVLLDVDGRVPGSVGHAVQILASYRAGETVKLHILRHQKRQELRVTMPDDKQPPEPGAEPATE